MDEVTTMTTFPALPSPEVNHHHHHHHHQNHSDHQSVSVLAVAPTFTSQLPSSGAGATVYIASSTVTPKADSPLTWSTVIPKVQSVNGRSVITPAENHLQQPAHIVKIKINPQLNDSRVISTVRLTRDQEDLEESDDERHIKQNNSNSNNSSTNSGSSSSSSSSSASNAVKLSSSTKIVDDEKNSVKNCMSISVTNEVTLHTLANDNHSDKLIQQISTESVNTTSPSSTGFYYRFSGSPLTTMVMSSGPSSSSDTLDSGTCSDMDGNPPPLPKKNSSRVVLDTVNTGQLTKIRCPLNSGNNVDSDDNESTISCDSLNSSELVKANEHTLNYVNILCVKNDKLSNSKTGSINEITHNNTDLKHSNNNNEDDVNKNYTQNDEMSSEELSDIASLSKSSSPNPLTNGRNKQDIPLVVNECTYEERKIQQDRLDQENIATEHYINYNRERGSKYVYEHDRFYEFHINELEPVDNTNSRKKLQDNETEEYFAGYKILDKEAIKSARGTVRGVKNRVRAGIATFLQNPTSKNYKQKDADKVVVYTTSMRVVPKTLIACMKMRQMLNTHMVQYEVRDLFGNRDFQTELKDRLEIDQIEVPQLFIDGQHIGDADAVERLNESGELRPMLKPYKYQGVRQVCAVCGGAGAILCRSCHGSKKSQSRRWKGFLNEAFALRCMNCDEVGLIRCPNC